MPGTKFTIEVQPHVPATLVRLPELANNLFYTWSVRTVRLFEQLDPDLWHACGHNPKLFLRRIAQDRLEQAATDRPFMEAYERALSAFELYDKENIASPAQDYLQGEQDLVAYFCAEFGLHESLPIYSGGLGILAGDHCKAASDLCLPFVAVGLLYRQGYLTQTIDAHGNQIAHFTPTDFESLPMQAVLDAAGNVLLVNVPIKQRQVYLKIWHARVGHINLYLLDSDISQNSDEDRSITYQLYGGDRNTRIQQEIVLSLGGVRALRALKLAPSAWHINEGHAAFLVLELCQERMRNDQLDFASALEAVAGSIVFTTHTPVPAGHDIFTTEQVKTHLQTYLQECNITLEQLMKLGESSEAPGHLNMTALAIRGSRFHNGVSKIHGEVASRMEQSVWPQIPADENPIEHITNGVHVPTFLAREWSSLFDLRFGDTWRNELLNEAYWNCIDDIPAHSFWSVRQTLKTDLLNEVTQRLTTQLTRNNFSPLQIQRITQHLQQDLSNTLVLGFARRFATYKRATLLFADPARLARLLNNPEQPVIVLFAGKAHPSDMPGQHLIKVVHDFSRKPEFEGKIILLENYDLALGRALVAGVDVWLNTPEYPLEASGTSGEKAGINGVLNLSVLDGWWGEGFSGNNGWAITPHGPQYDNSYRNQEEARELLDLLEHDVIPCYFQRNAEGFSEHWIQLSKNAMQQIIPRFNAQRMVMDYVRKFYSTASREGRRLAADNYKLARDLANWKQLVQQCWGGVTIKMVSALPAKLMAHETRTLEVEVSLNGLKATDLVVECLFGTESEQGLFQVQQIEQLYPADNAATGAARFRIDLQPPLAGEQFYKIRTYPCHLAQVHPLETGKMLWI